jgi:DNA repair protein RadD
MNTLFAPPVREIALRPYQGADVESLRDGFRTGHRRQVLVLPTGGGKSECAIHIIKESQKKGKTAWFIVDRISLIDQTSERFSLYGIEHGIIQADHWLTDLTQPVQIASAQTLARRKIGWLPDLIVVDECHINYASIRALIEQADKSKVLGLTATPFTKGMAGDWEGLVNSITTNQLIGQGFLAPLKIKACIAPDMKGVKKKFTGEYEDEEAGIRGTKIIGDVVQTWIEQTQKHFGGPVKTIVFSPSVAHGAELCRQFAEAGFNFQQISYLDSEDDKRDNIADFRRADTKIDGLVSCAVLTRGFDVPDIRCGISCRPYRKSFSSHIQEMGRVMRIFPGKEFGLWLDHSGNIISFADDTAWLFEYGVDSLETGQTKDTEVREPDEKTKEKYFCSQCGSQVPPVAKACPACGYERPHRSSVEVVEGELVDVELSAKGAFKPRDGLRAPCLRDPRAMWNAALSYCFVNGTKGQEASRKWAYGVWAGVYPGCKLPRGLYDRNPAHDQVQPDQYSLIDREVRRFRKSHHRSPQQQASTQADRTA